jgi:LCP family protein required for cell wall assembly
MQDAPTGLKRYRLLAITAAALLILVIIGWLVFPRLEKSWAAPMGPALELPTYTPTRPLPTATEAEPTDLPPTSLAFSDIQTSTHTPEPTATIAPTSTPEPLCGGPPVMYILGVGVDTEDDNYRYGLGDAIRVARVDFVTPKVTVLSLPRDLWVEIPGISQHYGITHGKLNQSFLYGGPGMGYYDGPGQGPGLMARTLDQNFGLRPDHYGAVNMITFERIVNAVGGVDVYLPTDVDGTANKIRRENMGYFYAGNNHFTGNEALRFSRIRKGIGDFNRADNQTLVLCALKEKLVSPSVLPKIPQIINAFKDSVVTDLSLEQMSQLACLLPHLKRENLVFSSLPEEIFQEGMIYSEQMRNNTFALQADPQVVRGYIEQFMAGTWSGDGEETTCP